MKYEIIKKKISFKVICDVSDNTIVAKILVPTQKETEFKAVHAFRKLGETCTLQMVYTHVYLKSLKFFMYGYLDCSII